MVLLSLTARYISEKYFATSVVRASRVKYSQRWEMSYRNHDENGTVRRSYPQVHLKDVYLFYIPLPRTPCWSNEKGLQFINAGPQNRAF